jgi:hypothetical protein
MLLLLLFPVEDTEVDVENYDGDVEVGKGYAWVVRFGGGGDDNDADAGYVAAVAAVVEWNVDAFAAVVVEFVTERYSVAGYFVTNVANFVVEKFGVAVVTIEMS